MMPFKTYLEQDRQHYQRNLEETLSYLHANDWISLGTIRVVEAWKSCLSELLTEL